MCLFVFACVQVSNSQPATFVANIDAKKYHKATVNANFKAMVSAGHMTVECGTPATKHAPAAFTTLAVKDLSSPQNDKNCIFKLLRTSGKTLQEAAFFVASTTKLEMMPDIFLGRMHRLELEIDPNCENFNVSFQLTGSTRGRQILITIPNERIMAYPVAFAKLDTYYGLSNAVSFFSLQTCNWQTIELPLCKKELFCETCFFYEPYSQKHLLRN